MKTWYFSPYPLSDADETQVASLLVGQSGSASSRPVSRASMGEGEKDSPRRRDSSVAVSGQGVPTIRAHGRTADMLAAGLSGKHVSGESVTLWVCDRCFKYMRDGVSWELHMVSLCAVERFYSSYNQVGSRKNATSSIPLGAECTHEVPIPYGKLTAHNKK